MRDGKGRKDRITMLPLRLVDPLRDPLLRPQAGTNLGRFAERLRVLDTVPPVVLS